MNILISVVLFGLDVAKFRTDPAFRLRFHRLNLPLIKVAVSGKVAVTDDCGSLLGFLYSDSVAVGSFVCERFERFELSKVPASLEVHNFQVKAVRPIQTGNQICTPEQRDEPIPMRHMAIDYASDLADD